MSHPYKRNLVPFGRNTLKFTLNVNDPKAKDDSLNSSVTAYVYELIQGIEDEELSLTKSKTISKTVTEVEIDGLEETTKYRLIVKKTSGETKELLSEDFTTTNLGSKENPIELKANLVTTDGVENIAWNSIDLENHLKYYFGYILD